jgi:DNA-binding protein Fis
MEREYVRNVLASLKGNKSHAAEILGISRARLRRILDGGEAG